MAVGLAQRHNIHRLRAPSPFMFVGYVRVSSETERQNSDLQRDALLAAGVDAAERLAEESLKEASPKHRLD